MATTQRLMTEREFGDMPDDNSTRFELVRGELIEVGGSYFPHVDLAREIQLLLHMFVREQRLGEVYPDGLGYVLARDPDTVRVPDVSFIARERFSAGGFARFVPFAPDLAVEVVSPTDRTDDVLDKVGEYLNGGTRIVWVVWPKRKAVSVHTADGTHEVTEEGELDGGDVLPGFRVRVADLFAVRR